MTHEDRFIWAVVCDALDKLVTAEKCTWANAAEAKELVYKALENLEETKP